MAKRRKLKKSVKKAIIIFIVLVILGIGGYKGISIYKYHQTYEYKLLQIEYTLDETKILINKLNNKQLDEILNEKKNTLYPKLINEKYFIYKNMNRYLDYISKNLKEDLSNVISLVNVNRDRDYYEDIVATDTTKGFQMLVNKYHSLPKEYTAENIIKTSSSYSYADNTLNEEVYNAFKNLADAAKSENHTILILSSYRTYEYQEKLWNERKSTYGTRKADQYAARAGSSEHETGFAIDVADFYDKNDEFGKTESFTWMVNNAYKYGFILRYPEGKENITGYSYEPWHYRYVGIEIATKIQEEKITFDEYYEYYLNK